MKNYSQNDEQEVILKYFGKFKGTFLDLGANDGITFSNTYALALSGWSGSVVEASYKAFDRLTNLYFFNASIYKYNFAVGKQTGVIQLNESGPLIGNEDVALVSTAHDHEMDRFKKVVKYNKVNVNCLSWPDFLKRSPQKTFDFISMDIEGSELEVLPDMDLSETKCICIEYNGKAELKRQYEKYLSGFNLIHTTAENLIYVR